MKASIVFGSLLAIAGTAATAESADAAISDADIQEELKQAVCDKEWYMAIEVSSQLINSPTITPEYRQTLLNWRRQFYTHVQGKAKVKQASSCAEIQISLVGTNTPIYAGPEPRFSSQRAATSIKQNSLLLSEPVAALSNIWTVGVHIEGKNIKGTILNNGITTAKNVTLTIRSQQNDNSEDIRTVAIETVRAWDEADFVAAFNDTPDSWMIESIEIN